MGGVYMVCIQLVQYTAHANIYTLVHLPNKLASQFTYLLVLRRQHLTHILILRSINKFPFQLLYISKYASDECIQNVHVHNINTIKLK